MARMNQSERDMKEAWFNEASQDGKLSIMEMKRCLEEQNGVKLSYEDVITMFNDLDENGDKMITLDEFMEAMDASAVQREKLKNFFQQLDTSGDGKLTSEEFLNGLASMEGVDIDMDHAREIVASVDTDGDGKVTFTEFINVMCP